MYKQPILYVLNGLVYTCLICQTFKIHQICPNAPNLPLCKYQFLSYSPNSTCTSTYFHHIGQTQLTTSMQHLLFGKCEYLPKLQKFWQVLSFANLARELPLLIVNCKISLQLNIFFTTVNFSCCKFYYFKILLHILLLFV
jgi:hypothetical protein